MLVRGYLAISWGSYTSKVDGVLLGEQTLEPQAQVEVFNYSVLDFPWNNDRVVTKIIKGSFEHN
jgi:hypothetical protein